MAPPPPQPRPPQPTPQGGQQAPQQSPLKEAKGKDAHEVTGVDGKKVPESQQSLFEDFSPIDGVKGNSKPIMIFFLSSDPKMAAAHQQFGKNALNSKDVSALIPEFDCYRVDVEMLESRLQKKYKISTGKTPIVIIFDCDGKKIQTVPGLQVNAATFVEIMKKALKANEKALKKREAEANKKQ